MKKAKVKQQIKKSVAKKKAKVKQQIKKSVAKKNPVKKARKVSLVRRVELLEKSFKSLNRSLSEWYLTVDEAIQDYQRTRFEVDRAIEKRFNDLFNEILYHRRAVEKQINQKLK